MTCMAVEAPELGEPGGLKSGEDMMDNRFKLRRLRYDACTVVSSVNFDKDAYLVARNAMYLILVDLVYISCIEI